MSKFECHITLPSPDTTEKARLLYLIAKEHKMKTSHITGDPVIGAGKWFYLSGYNTDYQTLLNNMQIVAQELRDNGFEVIREKIEQIMYDTKTGYFECGVNCFACL